MIPLVVCQIDDPQWKILGGLILLAATVMGYKASRISRIASAKWALAVFAVGALLPIIMMFGVWPVNGHWNYDCGFTPDPNMWVTIPGLAFPAMASLSFLWFYWLNHR